jgi:hypothetical protein
MWHQVGTGRLTLYLAALGPWGPSEAASMARHSSPTAGWRWGPNAWEGPELSPGFGESTRSPFDRVFVGGSLL